ncbi:hypothetical protein BC938DRAFT_479236 [Jimgerdemannia flammicorona]|uniref:Exportin-5 C-terminal domain-containing protein n=1 Tax=Jimgerdemannia flammicorona TaxID=994334 RepID=A0A433QLA0_9FUNG|nr:hypothetical protein BC938DRAFT_479236 [Jimgerdemannia flammicorona]
MNQCLSQLLPSVLGYIDQKLTQQWMEKGAHISTPKDVSAIEDEPDGNMSEEIQEEKILRDLTRAYAELFSKIFAPVEVKGQPRHDSRNFSLFVVVLGKVMH